MSRDALVVGINTYSYEGLNKLKAPAQDAEAIAQLLEKYGDFKVTRLPAVKDKENNTIKLGQKTKVNLNRLEDAIVHLFIPEGKPPDTALLYFSGHGLRKTKGRLQEGFLASSDVNPDMGNWGVRLKWLRELLQESEVKQQVIILDCCYSGELLNFTEADPGDRGKGRDRCFIAASRPFEVAYEEIDNRHSVFTAALLKGLKPLQDRWVTNYTLIDLINQEHHSFPQHPVFGNSGEVINLTRRWTEAGQDSTTSSTAICPYKGLRYFDCVEEDANFFYGRTALTDELLEKIRIGNFLAILGASGSGKSSVVRAGLLYQLKLGQRLSGSQNWQIKIFLPGVHPLHSLAEVFLDTELSRFKYASELAKAKELIDKGADGLKQLVTSLVIDDTQRLVLVVDQFEEVFTLCKDNEERQRFFECLLGSLQQCGDKLCLVLTMRSDFFGKCTEQEYSGLAQQIQQNLVTVTPMAREDLKKAIVEPANKVELKIEPELVEEMLTDVANAPGILPLLQDTLTELWEKRSDNYLRVKTYSQIGGVMGTLRQRATAVYELFDEEEKATCKRIFLELTQLGEGTEDTRRRCLKQDLINKHYSEELVNTVVQQLADEKLVVTSEIVASGDKAERVAVVDVAHEALIRHWTLLRKWIDENQEEIKKKRATLLMIGELRKRGKVNLTGVDLTDADLTGANLRDADLRDADLRGADLRDTNLAYADLRGADLRGAELKGTNFSYANLANTKMDSEVEAINNKWYLVWEILNRRYITKDLKGADLSYAYLISANLTGANLTGANLTGANLSYAYLTGTNLSSVCLKDAHLTIANLQGANLSSANLNGTYLNGTDLNGTDLRSADLRGAKLRGTDFHGADLRGTDLHDVEFRGVEFRGANLSGANLSAANLSSANLSSVNLSSVNLSAANLSEANLSEANLSEANLSEANLSDAKFWDIVWSSEAKNITPEQIKKAKNWEKAVYSPEFRKKLGLSPEKE